MLTANAQFHAVQFWQEMIIEADLDGDGKVSYSEFVSLVTNSDAKMSAPTIKGSHRTVENSVEVELVVDNDDLRDVCHIFIEEPSDSETETDTQCETQNIPPKSQLERMRSLSVGSRPVDRLEIPHSQHHRKKSLSDLLHFTSSRKRSEHQNEYRRSSDEGCQSLRNHDDHHNQHQRRFSTSGLHLKHFFKKHHHEWNGDGRSQPLHLA